MFYREEHHFSYLKEFIERQSNKKIKIWSAGCSTGEEVYSIGMSINELCMVKNISYSILGSDINEDVIQFANENRYEYEKIKKIYNIYKNYIKIENNYAYFSNEITKNIKFKKINLKFGWNLDCKIDVIFCRNVAIYFDFFSKDQLWSRLSQSLEVGGELYIGHSERIHNPSQYGLKVFGINAYRKVS
nr:CheR family methyltransferase [Neokomagataea anthophila]